MQEKWDRRCRKERRQTVQERMMIDSAGERGLTLQERERMDGAGE